jgi:hypothetical protein
MRFSVVPIAEEYTEGFRAAVDSVARERRYLALLEAPPPEESRKFVALVGGQVVGWCDALPHWQPTRAHSAVWDSVCLPAFAAAGSARRCSARRWNAHGPWG